jgi:hypothetical protein
MSDPRIHPLRTAAKQPGCRVALQLTGDGSDITQCKNPSSVTGEVTFTYLV